MLPLHHSPVYAIEPTPGIKPDSLLYESSASSFMLCRRRADTETRTRNLFLTKEVRCPLRHVGGRDKGFHPYVSLGPGRSFGNEYPGFRYSDHLLWMPPHC